MKNYPSFLEYLHFWFSNIMSVRMWDERSLTFPLFKHAFLLLSSWRKSAHNILSWILQRKRQKSRGKWWRGGGCARQKKFKNRRTNGNIISALNVFYWRGRKKKIKLWIVIIFSLFASSTIFFILRLASYFFFRLSKSYLQFQSISYFWRLQ